MSTCSQLSSNPPASLDGCASRNVMAGLGLAIVTRSMSALTGKANVARGSLRRQFKSGASGHPHDHLKEWWPDNYVREDFKERWLIRI